MDLVAGRQLLAEDWGGDVVMVPVSARAKTNLDLLLEMVLLVADLQDLAMLVRLLDHLVASLQQDSDFARG